MSFKIEEDTRYLLIVEGVDDKAFFQKLLENRDICRYLQILNLNGIDNLRRELGMIKNDPNYSNVRKILIVRDSDNNPDTSLQSVKDAVREILNENANDIFYNCNSRVGILMLPDSESEGSLEDLILDSCNENIRNIIENFIDQIEKEGLVIYKKSKYKVHCYFGAKCSHKLYIKLSNAIQNCDFIDFSHREILALRERVLNFFQEETDV